jgi:small GTP-binding protein
MGAKEATKVLIIGPASAGKTAMLQGFKEISRQGEVQASEKTVGLRLESLDTGDVVFTCWDMPVKHQALWSHVYRNADTVLFVVDAHDRKSMAQAREEVWRVLAQEALRGRQLIVAANKQDLPGAMSPSEVADCLLLSRIQGRRWSVAETSAARGDGLKELLVELTTGGTAASDVSPSWAGSPVAPSEFGDATDLFGLLGGGPSTTSQKTAPQIRTSRLQWAFKAAREVNHVGRLLAGAVPPMTVLRPKVAAAPVEAAEASVATQFCA